MDSLNPQDSPWALADPPSGTLGILLSNMISPDFQYCCGGNVLGDFGSEGAGPEEVVPGHGCAGRNFCVSCYLELAALNWSHYLLNR